MTEPMHISPCVCAISSFERRIVNQTMGIDTVKIMDGIFKQGGKVIYWAINLYSVLTEFFHLHIPIR